MRAAFDMQNMQIIRKLRNQHTLGSSIVYWVNARESEREKKTERICLRRQTYGVHCMKIENRTVKGISFCLHTNGTCSLDTITFSSISIYACWKFQFSIEISSKHMGWHTICSVLVFFYRCVSQAIFLCQQIEGYQQLIIHLKSQRLCRIWYLSRISWICSKCKASMRGERWRKTRKH